MKTRFLILVVAFIFNNSWADFSNTEAITHPSWPSTASYLPSGVPYIIELNGEWPTDCHPGEQKPIITEYTGDSALIEFETIVEHVTCNEVITPFRVLIDISDVFGNFDHAFGEIAITVRFGESEYKNTLMLSCPVCSPPPLPGPPTNPEAGLYYSNGLEKQGLLLARQNQRMGAFPLIYDDFGSSEWLLGAGGITEDVFFAELLESTGGQCLGCVPPDEPPQMGVVGKISMLMDNEGTVQVKIDDGLFTTYEPSEFGYGEFEVLNASNETSVKVTNLSGRWAFTESVSIEGQTTASPTSVLPLVFDVVVEDDIDATQPVENVLYALLDIEGEEVAEMLCEYRIEADCDLRTPTMEDDDSWYLVNMLSIERMKMTNAAPPIVEDDNSGAPIRGSGTVIRID